MAGLFQPLTGQQLGDQQPSLQQVVLNVFELQSLFPDAGVPFPKVESGHSFADRPQGREIRHELSRFIEETVQCMDFLQFPSPAK